MSQASWIGASYVLGRPVPVEEPYPHICHTTVRGTVTGRPVTLGRKECAACQEERQPRRSPK
jgi:hypothetical protein